MLRRTVQASLRVGQRSFSGGAAPSGRRGAALLGGVAVGGAGLGLLSYLKNKESQPLPLFRLAAAASAPAPQANVASQTKDHALYLWIHLRPSADPKAAAKAVSGLSGLVAKVCPPDLTDESDEVIAGVGFGANFYARLGKVAPAPFAYPHRGGANGDLPSTGGDIFVHAKSNSVSKLYELAAEIQQVLPPGSVAGFEDTYSFVYRNGRDLSGFIDGTENRADDEGRFEVAVNPESGGSFCITQKWIHDHATIRSQKKGTLEGWVGRGIEDSTEIKRKAVSSHVARMTSGHSFQASKPVEIVRQSMPFGTVGGESGLFFIGFAAQPANFEFMLRRMVGEESDGHCDDIMKLSKCVQGTYWYFPSQQDLKSL